MLQSSLKGVCFHAIFKTCGLDFYKVPQQLLCRLRSLKATHPSHTLIFVLHALENTIFSSTSIPLWVKKFRSNFSPQALQKCQDTEEGKRMSKSKIKKTDECGDK